MNLSALDINGSIMVVSQFTLHASTKRQSALICEAARPEVAIPLYESFVKEISDLFQIRPQQAVLGWYENRFDKTTDPQPLSLTANKKCNEPSWITATGRPMDKNLRCAVFWWIDQHGHSHRRNWRSSTIDKQNVWRTIIQRNAGCRYTKTMLADEMADVLWYSRLANQTGIDLTEAMARNMEKKTQRDQGIYKIQKFNHETNHWMCTQF